MIPIGKFHISSYNLTCLILLIFSIPSPGGFNTDWGYGIVWGVVIPFLIRFIRFKVRISNPNAVYVAIGLVPVFLALSDLFLVHDWWPVRQGFVSGALFSLILITVLDHVHSDEEQEVEES
ncbi:MAG: hypothetical protein HQM11_04820 [SAR324 cluster bacterium]|nr:hypothetical protein [SAR324 cluster bacterium]